MEIFQGISRLKIFKHPVVALGVFDGLHRGHAKILKAAVARASSLKGTSVVLTFWPHPQKVESLYSLEHRIRLLRDLGIGACIIINFNKKFARMGAETFIKKILAEKIGSEEIFIGENFRFGANALGDYKLLFELSKKYNYRVKKFSIVRIDNRPVSSTVIRKLIRQGRLEESRKLLGRRVSVLGSVIKGSRLGRKLGVPTANIDPHHEVIPPDGIYAAKINLRGRVYPGICYIGRKPTLSLKQKEPVIEVHIFNFTRNIYGEFIEIQFLKLIRRDKRFNSLSALALQIEKDIISCRKIAG